MGLAVDWTLRFGDIVSFGGFVIGGLSVIFMMQNSIKQLALKVGFLKETVDAQSKEIEKFGELLAVMGRYEERFISLQRQYDAQQRQIDDLRHGRGYIRDQP